MTSKDSTRERSCKECGSYDLEFKVWVDAHFNFIEECDEDTGFEAYCNGCSQLVIWENNYTGVNA